MPISAPDSPSRMAPLPNVAAVEQIRMSEARHSAKPAPTHGPLTAAMTGCGRFQIACGSAAIASWNRSRSMAGSDASSVLGPKLRMSIPEQNPRPAPVSTTAFDRCVRADRGERLRELVAHHLVDRVELFRPVQLQHNDAGVRPFDDQRLGHRTQRRGKPSTCWAMMLRWISEVPPAMVPPKLRA